MNPVSVEAATEAPVVAQLPTERADGGSVSGSPAAPSHASSEARLFDAYRGARTAIESLPCVCGGMVQANPESPSTGVQAHNFTGRHKAWRANREA